MGDKWTTSGGWRLKAKQSRTFAGRSTTTRRTNSTFTAATAAAAIGPMIIPKSNPHGSNLQSRMILQRNRNGGVQGSYSAYADPIARRAIAATTDTQDGVDGEYNPNHPLHQSRLQNNIRRRIRDPNQRNEIIAHYNPTYRSAGIRDWGYQQQNVRHVHAPNVTNLPPFYGQLHSNLTPIHQYPPRQFLEQTMYPTEAHHTFEPPYISHTEAEVLTASRKQGIPFAYPSHENNYSGDNMLLNESLNDSHITGIPHFQQYSHTSSQTNSGFRQRSTFTPNIPVGHESPRGCQIVPFENFNSPTEQEKLLLPTGEWFHNLNPYDKEIIPQLFDSNSHISQQQHAFHDNFHVTPSVEGQLPSFSRSKPWSTTQNENPSPAPYIAPIQHEFSSVLRVDPFDMFDITNDAPPMTHDQHFTQHTFEIPDALLFDEPKDRPPVTRNLQFMHQDLEIPDASIPTLQKEAAFNVKGANDIEGSSTVGVENDMTTSNLLEDDFFDFTDLEIPILQKKSYTQSLGIQESSHINVSQPSQVVGHNKDSNEAMRDENYSKQQSQPGTNKRKRCPSRHHTTIGFSSIKKANNTKLHSQAENHSRSKSGTSTDDSSYTTETIACPFVRDPKPCITLPYNIRFFNEGIEVDINNRPLSRPTSKGGSIDCVEKKSRATNNGNNEENDDFDLVGKTSLWG